MAEEKYTRCPGCRTVYRVTDEQLAQRDGRVRCGHCQVVFDGVAELVAPVAPETFAGREEAPPDRPAWEHQRPEAPEPPHEESHWQRMPSPEPPPEEAQQPEQMPRGALWQAVAQAPWPHAEGPQVVVESTEPEAPHEAMPADAAAPDAVPREPQESEVAPEPSVAPAADAQSLASAAMEAAPAPIPAAAPAPADRGARMFFAVAATLLALLLPLQAAFHFRETIAARWPAASPMLQKACRVLGCTVGAPREVTDLAIQTSDLQADPAHQGLLTLTATIRNRGAVPLAYPYVELTLTDAQDQVVVRRALTPAEYVGGTVDLTRGIPANSDVAIKLFIDASATTQAGYRLFLFYG